jgi:hypothetical protein
MSGWENIHFNMGYEPWRGGGGKVGWLFFSYSQSFISAIGENFKLWVGKSEHTYGQGLNTEPFEQEFCAPETPYIWCCLSTVTKLKLGTAILFPTVQFGKLSFLAQCMGNKKQSICYSMWMCIKNHVSFLFTLQMSSFEARIEIYWLPDLCYFMSCNCHCDSKFVFLFTALIHPNSEMYLILLLHSPFTNLLFMGQYHFHVPYWQVTDPKLEL